MGTSVHSDNYRELLALIRSEREGAGLTQLQLAERLGRPQSWVSKIEVGERRLDLEELRLICGALDIDLLKLIRSWTKTIESQASTTLRGRRTT